MAEQLNCTIEDDFSFEQKDCHWELTRFFRLTWDKADGQYLYYGLSSSATKLIDTSKIYTKSNSYIYELPLSAFTTAQLVGARDADGWTSLTVSCNGKQKTFYKFYRLELPPVFEEGKKVVNTELVANNPGEFRAYWDSAIELDGSPADGSPDDLNGYCVEIFSCPENSNALERLYGLKLITRDIGDNKKAYKIIKSEAPEDNTKDSSEVYLDFNNNDGVNSENCNQFYFEPVETESNKGQSLKLNRGDNYKFVVYPYSGYEGSFITTNDAAESGGKKASKGIVRVKTEKAWVEGEVWVYANTSTGPKWVRAESVYTRTNSGWVEAI